MLVQSGDRFLFIGDSITDAFRNEDPDGLGWGYVRMTRDLLWARYPERKVEVINRGVSGDTVRNLSDRWQEDVIKLEPTVLSISIGVNDVWSQLEDPVNPRQVLLDEFEAIYRRLLKETVEQVKCRLVLCEATPIGEDYGSPHNPLLEPYNATVAKLAVEFGAALIPMNRAFWRAINADPTRKWTGDGVHPYSNGHALMALTLFDTLNLLNP